MFTTNQFMKDEPPKKEASPTKVVQRKDLASIETDGISRYTKERNEDDFMQIERAFQQELRKLQQDDFLSPQNQLSLKQQFSKFDQEVKWMKHKLRMIGGTDESHIYVGSKGPVDVDVIPNTYVYIRVPVQDRLVYQAKLKFWPEPGFKFKAGKAAT